MNSVKKMFHAKEAKNLENLLDKVEDREDALCLELTPEPVMPSEWYPEIFGEGGPVFDDEKDAQRGLQCLTSAYNRMIDESNSGKLKFPFNYAKMSDDDLYLIEGWAYGLFLALSLRPHFWGMTEEYENTTDEEISEDMQEVIAACCVIIAVALPEERNNIYEAAPDDPPLTEEEMEADLYGLLPLSVETITRHGEKLRKERQAKMQKSTVHATGVDVKVGRNDLCPCGSGRKYKKCCGTH